MSSMAMCHMPVDNPNIIPMPNAVSHAKIRVSSIHVLHSIQVLIIIRLCTFGFLLIAVGRLELLV